MVIYIAMAGHGIKRMNEHKRYNNIRNYVNNPCTEVYNLAKMCGSFYLFARIISSYI